MKPSENSYSILLWFASKQRQVLKHHAYAKGRRKEDATGPAFKFALPEVFGQMLKKVTPILLYPMGACCLTSQCLLYLNTTIACCTKREKFCRREKFSFRLAL